MGPSAVTNDLLEVSANWMTTWGGGELEVVGEIALGFMEMGDENRSCSFSYLKEIYFSAHEQCIFKSRQCLKWGENTSHTLQLTILIALRLYMRN